MTDRIAEARKQITARTGAKTFARTTTAGVAVGVLMRPDDDDIVWSLVPIDDRDMDRWVDYLIDVWRRDGGKAPAADE